MTAAAVALGALVLSGGAVADGGVPAGIAASSTTMLYDTAPGFFPKTSLTVKAGTKMIWKTDRSNTTKHTVTVDSAKSSKKVKFFDSGDLGPGRTYTKTLKVKGTYSLYCKLHGGMFQTVKVR